MSARADIKKMFITVLTSAVGSIIAVGILKGADKFLEVEIQGWFIVVPVYLFLLFVLITGAKMVLDDAAAKRKQRQIDLKRKEDEERRLAEQKSEERRAAEASHIRKCKRVLEVLREMIVVGALEYKDNPYAAKLSQRLLINLCVRLKEYGIPHPALTADPPTAVEYNKWSIFAKLLTFALEEGDLESARKAHSRLEEDEDWGKLLLHWWEGEPE